MESLVPPRVSALPTGLALLLGSTARAGYFAMCLLMLSVGQGYKIFRAVIVGLSINVVNLLPRLETLVMRVFPYQAVLGHIARLVGKVMAWHFQQDMALLIKNAATLPKMVIGAAFAPGMMAVNVWLAIAGTDIARPSVRLKISHYFATTTGAKSAGLDLTN